MYSTYKKMIRKKVPVRQVYDARALRIIVDDEGGSRTSDAWAAAYRWVQCSFPYFSHMLLLPFTPMHVHSRVQSNCKSCQYLSSLFSCVFAVG